MTAEQPPGMAPLATLGQRLLARVLDTLVLAAIDVAVVTLAPGGGVSQSSGYTREVLAGVLTFLLYFAYEGAMTASRGQTLGKIALRIRAARLEDGAVPGSAGWTRAAVYALPGVLVSVLVGVLIWLLDCVWCTWDRPYRQCLHDKAARTVVVLAA